MGKSEELLRLERDLNEQPELRKKLDAECKHIAEAKDAKCDGEIMVRAAAALGYTITLEELERATAAVQELDPDEMAAAGGRREDEKGHNTWCLTAWHCFSVTLHTETKEKFAACWSDWDCIAAHKDYLSAYMYDCKNSFYPKDW